MKNEKQIKRNSASGIMSSIKTIIFLGVIGVAFYSGMWVTAYNSGGDAKEVMLTSISNALRSTEGEPVIMIIPEYSMWEKAKYMVVSPPERKVVEITTSVATSHLFSNDPEFNKSWVRASLLGTKQGALYAWNGVKNGTVYVWDGTKDGVVTAYEWVRGSDKNDEVPAK